MSKTQALGKIILKLHEGVDPEVVKEEFKEKFGSVTSREIIQMEQELVNAGMPIEEIQRLCDIHADIFNMSIEEIHALPDELEQEGHPVQVLKKENKALQLHLEDMFFDVLEYESKKTPMAQFALRNKINELFDLNKHYSRKEVLFFPLLEKYGFDAPPKVMWAVDDEIRQDLKDFEKKVIDEDTENLSQVFQALRKRIEDMIFKEEMIMLPMISEVVTDEEWMDVAIDSEDIGYCLVVPEKKWTHRTKSFYDRVKDDLVVRDHKIHLPSGVLKLEELEGVLNALPIDITFIDKDDKFRYFNLAKDRIFVRSKAALGRIVQHCHPPKSVNMVEAILNDLKSGKKDEESFWIEMKGMLIHISYHAVRNEHGEYLGTLEVSHDIMPYKEIAGQKRLRDQEK